MTDKRSRIIYPSQSVWANGNVLYRVKSFGSTTTFTTEDLYELGQLDTIDVVDDVPAVAVTLETDAFGDIYTLASLANVDTSNMGITATAGNANMVVNSGTNAIRYYHGVTLVDFASACGAGSSVDIWSPVQEECSIGTDTDAIEMTMFLGDVFINRVEWSFTAGANATENYTGETDNKTWFLNDGKYVSNEVWVFGDGSADTAGVSGGTGNTIASGTVSFGISLDDAASTPELVVTMSDGTLGFLKTDAYGRRAVRFYDASASSAVLYPIITGVAADDDNWVYDSTDNTLYMPNNFTTGTDTQYHLGTGIDVGDRLDIIYAANAFGTDAVGPSNQATRINAEYFAPISASAVGASASGVRVEDVGAIRQGQIEAYLVDPDNSTSYQRALRVTGVTLTADLTRTPLNELGSLLPYDRPVTLPIPFTITLDTTFSDLELFAVLAGKKTEYDASTLDDIGIYDLMAKDNMKLVIKLYQQTDQDAGGTAGNRKVLTSEMVGDEYFYVPNSGTDSTRAVYSLNGTEYPLETIVVEDLRITDEAYTLRVGDNATQTFGYRGNNSITVVRGDVWFNDLLEVPGFQRNA